MNQLTRLPIATFHRGKPVNVQQMLLERLHSAGERFNHPWGDLKWSIDTELTMHIYPPERITIYGEARHIA